MKRLFVMALMAFANCVWAQAFFDTGRIDVNGAKEDINLTKGDCSANGKCANAHWLDSEEKNKQCIYGYFQAVKGEWAQGGYSFTPDNDGTAQLIVMGHLDRNASPIWSYVDEIDVEGAEIV